MSRHSTQAPRRRRGLAVLVAALALVPGVGSPARSADPLDAVLGDPGTTLPNLVPDVLLLSIERPLVFDPATKTWISAPPELWVDIKSQNLGVAPMQLTTDDPDTPHLGTVSQCISWRADRVCREQRVVEGLRWREPSENLHIDGFASLQLRKLQHNGRVNYSGRGLVAAVAKTAFCFKDHDQVRSDGLPVPVYTGCPLRVQGISPTWSALSERELPKQQLSLDGLTDGRYAVVIALDTGHRFYESDTTDNVVEVVVEVSGGVTQVDVVERRYPPS